MSSLSNEKDVKQSETSIMLCLDNPVTDHRMALFARAFDVSSATCMFSSGDLSLTMVRGSMYKVRIWVG